MKKWLLLIAIFITAFSACNDAEISSSGKTGKGDLANSISFRTYVPKTVKGAPGAPTTTETLINAADGFAVYAYETIMYLSYWSI